MYSFSVVHRPPHAVFTQQCPFVVAIVELAEGPRMTSGLTQDIEGAQRLAIPNLGESTTAGRLALDVW